jgi:hypothetical protein
MSKTANEMQEHINKYYENVVNAEMRGIDLEIIKEMRMIHGRAIYELDNYKKNMAPIPENFIMISKGESIIYVIHAKIRKIEKKFYKKTSNSNSDSYSLSPSAINKKYFSNEYFDASKIKARLTSDTAGDKLVSISGIETTPHQQKKVIQPMQPTQQIQAMKNENKPMLQKGGYVDEINTDYFDDMSSEEADRILKTPMEHKAGKSQLDITKPTIINYWANWCGPSNHFFPEWTKFKNDAMKSLPGVQVLDLDVTKNLNKLAMDAGVKGFPTVVVFNKGKMHHMVCAGATAQKLMEFVKKCLQ